MVPGGPADKAGMQQGDVITEVDGDAVQRPRRRLAQRSGTEQPGDRSTMRVERGGRTLTLHVTLGEADPRTSP